MLPPRSSIVLAALLHATQGSVATYIARRSAPNSTSGLVFFAEAYYINITLGGSPYAVSIDTGSSDLWVAGDVPHATVTNATATVQYAIGSDSGPVEIAPLEILGFTVPSQAFIQVASGGSAPDGTGLIGLGPHTGSQVFDALNDQITGVPPLDNIFHQDLSTPNYVTVLLNRQNDTSTYTGAMTISEVLPQYSNLSSQPKVPVSVLQTSLIPDQHWSVILDKNGVIGPDGKAVKLTSNATDAPTHDPSQMVAVFDTGFTLPQVPSDVASAMYSGAKGATLKTLDSFGGDVWVIDCDAEVNVTFLIGGQPYPVNPLDANQQGVDDDGNAICFGAFQPLIAGAVDPTFDMILGMGFLTNVYLLINYGDFIDGTTNTDSPYVQLLSMTDPAQAHADWVATRLEGKNSSPTPSSTNPSSSNPSPGPGSNNDGNKWNGIFQRYRIPILAGAAVVGALFIFATGFGVLRARRRAAYRAIASPAPVGSMQMNTVSGYNAGTQPAPVYNTYAPPYADPWNRGA